MLKKVIIMTLAKLVKSLRTSYGLTQAQFGDILNVSRATVGDYELGRSTISLEYLIALSKYFDVSLDWMVDNTPYAEPPSGIKHVFNQLNTDYQAVLINLAYALLDVQRNK